MQGDGRREGEEGEGETLRQVVLIKFHLAGDWRKTGVHIAGSAPPWELDPSSMQSFSSFVWEIRSSWKASDRAEGSEWRDTRLPRNSFEPAVSADTITRHESVPAVVA